MVTDRELWKTMTASEIRAYRRGEKSIEEIKEQREKNKALQTELQKKLARIEQESIDGQRNTKQKQVKKSEAKKISEKEQRDKDRKKIKQQSDTKTISVSIEVPLEIAEQFKKKLKKDKLSVKNVFDVAVYQYVNDELRINKEQPKK